MLSKLVDEYMMSMQARRLSPNTILDYGRTLKRFVEFVGTGADARNITSRQIEIFLASLTLGKKSIQNCYVGLSAFWTWLVVNSEADRHVVQMIPRPKASAPAIVPFSEAEIRRLLDGCKGRLMLRCAIMLLLDTGVRASELRDIDMGDIDQRKGEINVRHGKGDKGRLVIFSPSVGQAIVKYSATRADRNNPDAPLFIALTGARLDRRRLANQLENLGKKCGVPDVYPHRFRHTFAIQYLKNNGDLATLQRILGHESIITTKRYLYLAQVDIDAAHKKASPVSNWRL